MVYVTTKCPHCNYLYRNREGNPIHQIDSPFVPCPKCGEFFVDPYREEWITKSPTKRRFFFIGNGTWARALLLPLAISAIVFGGICGALLGIEDLVMLIPVGAIVGTPTWLILEYRRAKAFFKEDIEASIIRTKNKEYVALLKKTGYTIYSLDKNY